MTVAEHLVPGARARAGGGTDFALWAPVHAAVDLVLDSGDQLDGGERVAMRPAGDGWFTVFAAGARPGDRYAYAAGGRVRPDPASGWQPEGVHGPSAIVDPAFAWSDAEWIGYPLDEYVISELHVGTFTPAGTFAAAAERLPELAEIGITAVEVMPVCEFPGARNWGYDGVFPFSVQHTYGGPEGLRAFVDAAHRHRLCVVLDVVYNHLGPEGNVLGEYGPYFTDRYRTPWGPALNFDGPGSDKVRDYFVESARRWVDDFHVDGLRLDAVHAIVDNTARPFVEELTAAVHAVGTRNRRRVHVIAESATNDPRVATPVAAGGLGCDAVWNDDFHHALHVALTGERQGYYADFSCGDLATAMNDTFVYAGRYSEFRGRRHGRPARGLRGDHVVVFAQNHDQIGNRPAGDRLTTLTDAAGARLAAALVLLAPFVPLLFMGDEYGETAPFPYFTSHTDAGLVEAVRRGRRAEFPEFGDAAVPDPQAESTFASAVLHPERGDATMRAWYRALLRLRRDRRALATLDPTRTTADADDRACTLVVRRRVAADDIVIAASFAAAPTTVAIPGGAPWTLLLRSEADGVQLDDPGRAVRVDRTVTLGRHGVIVISVDL